MINKISIYHVSGKLLFSNSFNEEGEKTPVGENIIIPVIKATSDAGKKTSYLAIGDLKIVFKVEGEIAVAIFSDKNDLDSVLEDYSSRIIKRYKLRYGDTSEGIPDGERQSFISIVTSLVTSPTITLKIIMIGEPNTGKTSILKILNKEEPKKIYVPSVDAGGGEFPDITSETVVNVWDLPGREEHRWLWERYAVGCDIICIVTDSTTPNLLATMESWGTFKSNVSDEVMVFGLANMQDKKDALDAEVVGNILGFKTYPLTSKSLEDRGSVLRVFKEICESYILKGVEKEVKTEKQQLLDTILSIKHGLEKVVPPNHPIFISFNGWVDKVRSKKELNAEDIAEFNKAIQNWTLKLEELMKT